MLLSFFLLWSPFLRSQGISDDTEEAAVANLDETIIRAEQSIPALDLSKPGANRFNEDGIRHLSGAVSDPNELLEIFSNTQFNERRARLNAESLSDLSPTQVSISGGRPYENSFIIDGIPTNNLLDSLSRRGFDSVAASNQAVFIDSDLLESLQVFDSSVPAEYGDFLGGAVISETRDPRDRLSVTFSGRYSSSALTEYLLDEAVRNEILSSPDPADRLLPGVTKFQRHQARFSVDLPVSDLTGAIFSYGRQTAAVTRGALSSSYFLDTRPRDTIRENYFFKLKHNPDSKNSFTFQSLLTPYEDQYWRSSLSRQQGGGTSTKFRWDRSSGQSDFTADLAYTTANNSRTEEPVHFIYDNTPGISWIPSDIFSNPDARQSGLAGGFGYLENSQQQVDLALRHHLDFDNSGLTYGLQARHINGFRARPHTNFSYRDAQPTFGLPIAAADLTDGTIIQNEQFLQERNDYLAYEAEAVINQFNIHATYAHELSLTDWLTLEPSLGLRYSYDDFLGNHNFAPRLNLKLGLPLDIGLTVGANRYYAKNQLVYALREQNPDNMVYKRDFTFDGTQFTVGDWQLHAINRENSFGSSNLDTPYSEELSASLTLPVWSLGILRIKGISRDNRDSFARSEPIPDTFTDETGVAVPFDRFELTNRGFSKYRSLSLDWSSSWRNHTFTAATTFSENIIAPGTDTLLSNTDVERLDKVVRYNGRDILYRDLEIERENFNTPFYVSFSWISRWLEDRLTVGLRGRFRAAYETIQSTDEFEEGLEVYEDRSFDSQFLIDGSLSYVHEFPALGPVEFEVLVDNIFNTLPNVGVTRANPYQQGRAFTLGARFTF